MSLSGFENQIKQWVQLDNQLKELNERTRELREKRNNLEKNLTNYAASNNLSSSTVQISDGKLKFTNTRVPEPLTFKYLEKTLGEVIKNETQVKLIMDHIKQKRGIKVVLEIKRFSNN
jgi:seryl-tRNA synthetase